MYSIHEGSKYNDKKGQAGEKIVSDILNELLQSGSCIKVWNNVDILGAQIDHMVLYRQGILFKLLVIETKNWSGKITGKAYEEYWTVNCYGKTSKRYNPILQNKRHCSLAKLLFFWCKVKNIIVFVGDCEFPKIEYWQCGCDMFNVDGFKNYLGMS